MVSPVISSRGGGWRPRRRGLAAARCRPARLPCPQASGGGSAAPPSSSAAAGTAVAAQGTRGTAGWVLFLAVVAVEAARYSFLGSVDGSRGGDGPAPSWYHLLQICVHGEQ